MHDEAAFTVAQGLASGLSRSTLRNLSWEKSVYGVRTSRRDLTLEERCRMYDLRLEGAIFSHATAALLHGMPLPLSLERSPLLHVAFRAPARAPHVRGIQGHKLDLERGDVTELRGIRLTSAARTWCDLSTVLSLTRLVAAGDHVIHHRSPLCSREQLASETRRFAGHRGVRLMRVAVGLLSERAESPPESMFRVIAVTGGLPAPTINHTLIDTATGRDIRPDFTFEKERVLVEYQGDYHRTTSQWRKDMTRKSRLESMGWRVVEVNWDDLADPAELVARIRRTLAT